MALWQLAATAVAAASAVAATAAGEWRDGDRGAATTAPLTASYAPNGVYAFALDERSRGGWRASDALGGETGLTIAVEHTREHTRERRAAAPDRNATGETGRPGEPPASRYAPAPETQLVVRRTAASAAALSVAGALKPADIFREARDDRAAWARGKVLRARVLAAPEPGALMTVQLVARHEVWGWFATEPTRLLNPGEWTNVYWPLDGGCPDWVSLDSAVAWNDTIRQNLSRVGLRFYTSRPTATASPAASSTRATRASEAAASTAADALEASATTAVVTIRIADIVIEGVEDTAAAPPPLEVLGLRADAHGGVPTVGQRYELSFELSRAFDNPFDPSCVAVDALFDEPDGATRIVPAFYFQDFARRRLSDKTEVCEPVGRACWKVRYLPTRPGAHGCRIQVVARAENATSETLLTARHAFDVQPAAAAAPFRGFLRVDARDNRFLSFDDGTFFYPIGLIVRSPADWRREYNYEFDMKNQEGTFALDHYFTGMAGAGMNFTRMWMGAWWGALEWTHGYDRNYEGLGRYNLRNAWQMDYVFDLCEKTGIYMDITLHNFGQFSYHDWMHSEWFDNPYAGLHGGVCDQPEAFWTDPRARDFVRQRLRYLVARWGYCPAIAWWELFNEVDLVTNFRVHADKIVAWHRDMARYLRAIDPWRHLITTHNTYANYHAPLFELPEMEINQCTGYCEDMIKRMEEQTKRLTALPRPGYLNEFGVGANDPELRHNLHAGLWYSAVTPLCGAALFWWWPYVDAKGYPQYQALGRFHQGEDYRGRGFQLGGVAASSPVEEAEAIGMRSDREARAWVFDPRVYRGGQGSGKDPWPVARRIQEATLAVDGLSTGTYQLEFWDTWAGKIVQTAKTEYRGGGAPLTAPIPPFQFDIACKIRLQSGGEAKP